MSDGQTHLIGNLALGTAITGTVLWLQPDLVIPVFIGSVAGLIITPDLDIDHATETERIMNMIPGAGWLFGVSFYGYALLARHRGLSHNLLLGTLGRVLWTTLIIMTFSIFLFGICQLLGFSYDPLLTMYNMALIIFDPALLLAWFAMDILHYILDV